MGNIWSLLNLGVVRSSIVEGGESSINSPIENLYYIGTTENPTKTHKTYLCFVVCCATVKKNR